MASLTSDDVTTGVLAIATLLLAARAAGGLARRFHQPAVLGEIVAGVVLGPSVLGALRPDWMRLLVPEHGGAVMLETVTTLGVTLFIFAAGIEVDFAAVRRQRRVALVLSAAGFLVPFVLGLAAARYAPWVFSGEPNGQSMTFAVFLATALSISALPVIAKTLMDLDLYQTRLGVLIIAAGFFIDTLAGLIFVIVLGTRGDVADIAGITGTIATALAFVVVMCTVGRWMIHRALLWLERRANDASGAIGFALGIALLAGAFTQWLGLHSLLGAFLAGVAIGDSAHLHDRTRATIRDFVSSFFAPVFFASIGLRVNLLTELDWSLTLTLLVLACVGKVMGCGLTARLMGLARREAWAIGFGMNARGAMEIVFGLLGLQYGLISPRMLVALVLLAIVTSMMSGPMMRYLLEPAAARRVDSRPAAAVLHILPATAAEAAVPRSSRTPS
jgi:Kef-type K+ transport system membrane component KefB